MCNNTLDLHKKLSCQMVQINISDCIRTYVMGSDAKSQGWGCSRKTSLLNSSTLQHAYSHVVSLLFSLYRCLDYYTPIPLLLAERGWEIDRLWRSTRRELPGCINGSSTINLQKLKLSLSNVYTTARVARSWVIFD